MICSQIAVFSLAIAVSKLNVSAVKIAAKACRDAAAIFELAARDDVQEHTLELAVLPGRRICTIRQSASG